ncbi:hypothetical protein B0H16DRAFT_1883753 [Mycena metata]|uniref:Uncharacterized protein n=1 Tax=Mycena metata TaxID=1033252 RepID=A0AAD7NJU5_9AGAR|nr:hypothetical protein B0H16DRAFT_1883753 [Mycena metata]
MGALYDLAVPLIDRPASSCYVSWPGHDGVSREDKLTLMAYYTTHRRPELDERFLSDGPRVTITFGESVKVVELTIQRKTDGSWGYFSGITCMIIVFLAVTNI